MAHIPLSGKFYWGLFLAAATSLSVPVRAQTVGAATVAPDENGVNMATGGVYSPPVASTGVSIGGAAAGGLSYFLTPDGGFNYNITDGSYYNYEIDDWVLGLVVTSGGKSELFHISDAISPIYTYTPDRMYGSSLVYDTVQHLFTYTGRDGTIVSYPNEVHCFISPAAPGEVASKVVRPSGEVLTLSYNTYIDSGCLYGRRLQDVSSSKGYKLRFNYASNTVGKPLNGSWGVMTSTQAINSSVDYCDPTSITCPAFTQSWPQMTFSYPSGETDVTGPDGRVSKTTWSGSTFSYFKGINSAASISYQSTYVSGWPGYNVTRGTGVWTYSFSPIDQGFPSESFTATRIRPGGGQLTVFVPHNGDANIGSVTDELGRITRYYYNTNKQLQYVVSPEGTIISDTPMFGYTKYEYDTRGNITGTTVVPKINSGLNNMITSAGFDTACNNPKTCNQPNWVKDANGNQTDFTYDANSGGVQSELRPAAAVGGVRSLKLTTYVPRNAMIKNASGALVQSPDAIRLPSTQTDCQFAPGSNPPACDTSAPQTLTTFEYGASTTSEALLVKGIAVTSSANPGTTLRTCYTYDIYGRKISETTPLGGC